MRNTFTHELDFRQERDFGQKISATFEFIGSQWRPLGKTLLYLVLPVALISSILLGVGQATIFNRFGSGATGFSSFSVFRTGFSTLLGFGGLFITYLLLTTTLYEYVRLRMALPTKEEVTPALVWPQVRSALPWLLVGGLVSGMLVGLAFMFLVIPGVYLLVAWSPLFAVMIIERSGFSQALSRSMALVSGHWWATLGLLFIMWLIQSFLSLIFQVPLYAIMVVKVMHWPLPFEDALMVIAQAIGSLGQAVLYIPTVLAVLFQYFNLVEIKDGLGLHALVNSIGQEPAAAHNHSYQPDEEGEY